MVLPSTVYEQASKGIQKRNLYIPGSDRDDALSIYVTAGWEACEGLGRWDWPLFHLAGRRGVMDAITYTQRRKRAHWLAVQYSAVIAIDGMEWEAPADGWEGGVVDRVALDELVEAGGLSDMELAAVDRARVPGERAMHGVDKQNDNAMCRALRKLVRSADGG